MGFLELLRRLLGLGGRRGGCRGEYGWLIEVRPVVEKYLLKRRAWVVAKRLGVPRSMLSRVPHITLVYNFRLKRGVSASDVMRRIVGVAARYGRIPFLYDGIELRRREHKAGYVLAFRVRPSIEMLKFRREIYEVIKPVIEESSESRSLNEKATPWLHATIALGQLPRSIHDRFKELDVDLLLPSEVWRVTLLYRGRIVYEYDHVLRRVLTRKEALSRRVYANSVRVYRLSRSLEARDYRRAMGAGRVWIVADLHLGHGNIIKYTARPFSSIEEMDSVLVRNWNSVVAPGDTVYIVGDLAFRGKAGRYLRMLSGRKLIIRGNHDEDRYACCERTVIRYGGLCFILQHKPGIPPQGCWLIHGHKHNNDLRRFPFLDPDRRLVNVSIELTRYKPVSLDTIVVLVRRGVRLLELPEEFDPLHSSANNGVCAAVERSS